MLSKINQLFSRLLTHSDSRSDANDDLELDWLNPPRDPLNTAAWDTFWIEHVRHGVWALSDMFCDDRPLVSAMNSAGMNTILCAGFGVSQEPLALSQAGFDVVAMDISPQAIEFSRSLGLPPERFTLFCDPEMRRLGGKIDFVTGNILDDAVCSGPFDVIIERRTAQLYAEHDLGVLMAALAKRLSPDGIFFSHCHDGRWRPPGRPTHFTRPWFQENRWVVWNGRSGKKPKGQVAWLFTTTG